MFIKINSIRINAKQIVSYRVQLGKDEGEILTPSIVWIIFTNDKDEQPFGFNTNKEALEFLQELDCLVGLITKGNNDAI